MILRRSTYLGLAALALTFVACTPPGDGEDEDKPAVPIEADDAATVLAEQVCAQLFACECASTEIYASEADCVAEQRETIEALIDPVLAAGGTWDPQCAGEMSKAIDKWGCLGPTLGMNASSFEPRACPILKGPSPLGAECSRYAIGDTCAVGLTCLDQICIEQPQLPVPLGGVCEYNWDELPCAAGTYCAYQPNSDVRICAAIPEAGDACNPNEGSLCGPSSNDLVCDWDSSTCVAGPGEGEPCFDGFLCGPGTYCDGGKDFTCQPRRELGEGCGADAVCPVDASCVNNICQADQALVCTVPNYWGFF